MALLGATTINQFSSHTSELSKSYSQYQLQPYKILFQFKLVLVSTACSRYRSFYWYQYQYRYRYRNCLHTKVATGV